MFYRHDQDPADTPFCTLYRDRTCDLLYVRQPLLPSELRVLVDGLFFLSRIRQPQNYYVNPLGIEPKTPTLKV